jgi:NTP pyrophosphatase (non-canonical NTP hydrolase)
MESDSQTTMGELREAIAGFVAERSWERFHTPKNLAMSIAIEAAELMELFQWQSPEDAPKPFAALESDAKLAAELADVLIYCFALANRKDIDLSTAIRAKLGQNAARFPIGSEPP